MFTLEKDSSTIIIGIWVDDLLVLSNDNHLTKLLKAEIENEFQIRDLGEPRELLGLIIERNDSSLKVNQCHYIAKLLEKFGMTDSKPTSTPMDLAVDLVPQPTEPKVTHPYRELIGSLIWLSTCTRPDIAFATHRLASYCEHPTELHWKAAKRVLRYLKGTQSMGITYSSQGSEAITGFADADYAGDKGDRKSTSGCVFIMAGGAICWESKKQKCVSVSTCEAEYISMSDAAREIIFLVTLYETITGLKAVQPILYSDSMSAKQLAENPVTNSRSKHIDVKFHHIRDCLEKKLFDLVHIGTADMTADILTKSLPGPAHMKHTRTLGLK